MTGTLSNTLALLGSLIAMISLSMMIPRIGGSIGLVLKLLIAGIFFSVFIHAAIEFAVIYKLLPEQSLMPVMGTLLFIGSLFFIFAGILGNKSLRQR